MSTAWQELKHLSVINTVFITNPKNNPTQTTMKKFYSIPPKTNGSGYCIIMPGMEWWSFLYQPDLSMVWGKSNSSGPKLLTWMLEVYNIFCFKWRKWILRIAPFSVSGCYFLSKWLFTSNSDSCRENSFVYKSICLLLLRFI